MWLENTDAFLQKYCHSCVHSSSSSLSFVYMRLIKNGGGGGGDREKKIGKKRGAFFRNIRAAKLSIVVVQKKRRITISNLGWAMGAGKVSNFFSVIL